MLSTTAQDDTVSNLKNSAHELNSGLHNTANQAGRKVRNLFNTASDEISHASDTVTQEIRTNPVRSSMIALGVGVLLGALLRR